MNLLSPSRLIIAPLLSLAFSSSVLAQAIPRLTQGMPYQKARQMLLKNGWQAVEVNPTVKEEIQRSLQAWFLKRGFNEVESCAATGLGTCRAIFHDDNGKTLVVFTTPGSLGDRNPVKVTRWRFE